ncbi:hypothetical protein CN994_18470 [Bacillus anthracis]|nr:hypothetical protein CN994_18470 [Bacillus anthracis]
MQKIQKAVYASEGWRIQTKMVNFGVSIYTFQKNNEELVKLLKLYENDFDFAMRISSVDKKEEFDAFLTEITRLLHNYLAAAKTLIDHTRKLFQDEYKETDFEIEYNTKIKETFTDSKISKFIQELRNYCLHRKLPITGASISFSRDTGTSQSIHMSTESLIDWNNWSGISKEYLTQQGERVGLLQLINGYTEIVTGFQMWFKKRQYEIHSDSMKELVELQKEYNAIYEKVNKLF